MKVKQANSSSIRTKKAIHEEFARLLYKYKSIDKISVTKLVAGAKISRSTFYTHYNSIADVAADIKNETMRVFFDHQKVKTQDEAAKIFEQIYRYLKKNDRIFKLMFKAPAAADFAMELGARCRAQMLEQVKHLPLKDQYLLETELSMLADGLALLCIRYYRGELDTSLEAIFECAQIVIDGLINRRGLPDHLKSHQN